MKYKSVLTYSPDEKLYRICRVVWHNGTVGDGNGYSCKLSLGVKKTFPFVQLKFHKSYGGFYV